MKYILIELDVLENEKLTSTEKIMYGYIVALSSKRGYTFIKINVLSKICKLSTRQINRCIKKLVYFNYIQQKIVKKVRYIQPTINKFIEERDKANENKKIELIDYDWLNDDEEN